MKLSNSELLDLIECCRYGIKAQHEIINDRGHPDFVKKRFKENVIKYNALVGKLEVELSQA